MALAKSPPTRHLYAYAIGLLAISTFAYWRLQLPQVKVLEPENNVPVIVFGLGQVDAERISGLGFEVDGVLGEIFVKVGDHIVKDKVVAQLHSRRQELAVAIAQQTVQMAEATVHERVAQVETTNATVALKHEIAERAQQLMRRGAGTAALAQDSENEQRVAASDRDRAVRALATARATVEQARAQLAREKETLARHQLMAPYDGVVTERLQNIGAAIPMGTPVITFMDPTSLRVLAYVDEGSAGMLQAGQSVSISLRSRPADVLFGHIDRIDPRSDRVTEERRVYVTFDSSPGDIFLDEQAEVRINVGTIERAILVPEMIVRNRDGAQGSVWAIKNGHLVELRVSFGRRLADGRLELLSELSNDVQIVGERLPNATSGAAVRTEEKGRS
jgi:HlyD family secretion protein